MDNSSKLGAFFDRLGASAQQAMARSLDRHLVLAVTGLSRAGKSAFITSLLYQLINFRESRLPFFRPSTEQRLLGVRRVQQKRLDWVRYPYENALQGLHDNPPVWPASTEGVSTVSLELAFRPTKQPLAALTDRAVLTLDIIDYPGEWLLDLPLLELSYSQWCAQVASTVKQRPQVEGFTQWQQRCAALDLTATADEYLLAELAAEYAELLKRWRKKGIYSLQPGRFVLPGELAGTPLLQFFPHLDIDQNSAAFVKGSLGQMLEERFEQYKSKVVKRFYRDYFSRFDRQIVLVDPLTALGSGHQQLIDMQSALQDVLGSFRYGQRSVLRRLFAPRIDKVLLAATKVDHVTPEQHTPLIQLLRQLMVTEQNPWSFADIELDCIALAAIKAGVSGKSVVDGQERVMLKAVSLNERQPLIIFPGDVPSVVPPSQFFEQHKFNFVPFAPPMLGKGDNQLPHIGMDRAMQFLLGDKLQ